MADSRPRGIKEIIQALKWSLQGLKAAFRYEASFRLEVYLFIILVPIYIFLAQSALQLWMLIGTTFLVLLVEMINSAIEAAVDMVCGDKHHELAGRAKDMGSAAVFMSQMLVLFTWAIVIYQNYLR